MKMGEGREMRTFLYEFTDLSYLRLQQLLFGLLRFSMILVRKGFLISNPVMKLQIREFSEHQAANRLRRAAQAGPETETSSSKLFSRRDLTFLDRFSSTDSLTRSCSLAPAMSFGPRLD